MAVQQEKIYQDRIEDILTLYAAGLMEKRLEKNSKSKTILQLSRKAAFRLGVELGDAMGKIRFDIEELDQALKSGRILQLFQSDYNEATRKPSKNTSIA